MPSETGTLSGNVAVLFAAPIRWRTGITQVSMIDSLYLIRVAVLRTVNEVAV